VRWPRHAISKRLALLPYGTAYLVWLMFNITCLATAIQLLAPRLIGPWSSLIWLPISLLFLPVQFGLIMGQTSMLTLLGFSVFVRLCAGPAARTALALIPWAWKPQMLPVYLIALLVSWRWRHAVLLVAFSSALIVTALSIMGLQSLADYLAAAASKSTLVVQRSDDHPPGQTLLGLAQSVVGVGPLAVAFAVAGAGAIACLVALLWGHGLATDARRELQFAVLPLGAVLAAPHALAYELSAWLASIWLLLHYAQRNPGSRGLILTWIALAVAGGDAAVLLEPHFGFEWAALVGILGLSLIAVLYWHAPLRFLVSGRKP
jgi:hypothetical protein